MCEELSSKCRLSVLGLTNHAAIMSWTTVEPRQTGASWSERYTLPRILILRWPTCLTGTCSTCSPSRCSSATAVRSTWSRLTSVNENHDPPIIVTLGIESCTGLHVGKLACDNLSKSGKPLVG